jgi:hypothetical protein
MRPAHLLIPFLLVLAACAAAPSPATAPARPTAQTPSPQPISGLQFYEFYSPF